MNIREIDDGLRCPVCQDVAVGGWECPYCCAPEDSPELAPMPEHARQALIERYRRGRPPELVAILATAPGVTGVEVSTWASVRTIPGGAP